MTAAGSRGAARAAGDAGDDEEGTELIRLNINDISASALSQTTLLQSGDTVLVPKAETVYVFGHVRSPGAYPIQRDMTVLQALALAGGLTEQGSTSRIRLVRTVDGDQTEVRVKLTDTVQAGDTIVVPERFF